METSVKSICEAAKAASHALLSASRELRDNALLAMADAIDAHRADILAANAEDVAAARANGLSTAMVDRLSLDDKRIDGMVAGIRKVASLPDPLSRDLGTATRPDGLVIAKRPSPIGVIAIIFESRPNVTADAASLCVKSGNAVILRGGKEAIRSNTAIVEAISAGAVSAGLPANSIQLMAIPGHDAVNELVAMDGLVDLAIPRGGESLIRAVVSHARVPVLKHYNGICHVFIDSSADQDAALAIIRNAKCQRPGTCNAAESILVHSGIASAFIPKFLAACREWGVKVHATDDAAKFAGGFETTPACESDFRNEYLALELTLSTVPDTAAAVEHINKYGSHHSDAILTRDDANAQFFTANVDSAAVYVNASTRFTDGGEFGMGCEMGISTDKLHARGPVGIVELTTYKYVVTGANHVRK